MRFFVLFAATALSTIITLAETIYPSNEPCLNDATAQQVATNFANILANYTNELADQVLAPNLVDNSSSVNTLIDAGTVSPLPLLSPLYTNRTAFEEGQSVQPTFPVEQLNLWYTCATVIVRWMSNNPANGVPTKAANEPVVGNSVLEVGFNDEAVGDVDTWLIEVIYSEFNSGAWLVDYGVFKPDGPTS